MANFLYRWPEAAKFARRVPKEKFYEHGAVNTATREKFISDVQRITWAFKLAEATINLPGTATVPEIQILTIDAKGSDVKETILSVIDKAIPFPTIYEITRRTSGGTEVRMVATPKQLGTGKPKLNGYYSTDWQPTDTTRKALPTALSLPALYTALLQPLMPLTARPGERMSDIAERLVSVRKLEREVASLERKLHAEPQFNRKVELRRTLMMKQQELEQQR